MSVEVAPLEVVHGGGRVPAYACVFALRNFHNADGDLILAGDPSKMSGGYCRRVEVTMLGNVVTIPALLNGDGLDPTYNSVTGQSESLYVLGLYTSSGGLVDLLYQNIKVPDTPAMTTWEQLDLFSNATHQPMRRDYYDTYEVNRLIEANRNDLEGYSVFGASYRKTLNRESQTIVTDMFEFLSTMASELSLLGLLPTTPEILGYTSDSPTRVTVSWTPIEAAVDYNLQISTSSNFQTGVTEINPAIVSSYQFTRLTPDTPYYVRVAALDDGWNQGDWSNIVNFTTEHLYGPNDIASVWAFYEVDSFVGAEDGDLLTAEPWVDKSPNGRDIAGTNATFRENQLDIQPALEVAGGFNPSIGYGVTLPDMSALTAGEMFIVMKQRPEATGQAAEGGVWGRMNVGNTELYGFGAGTCISSFASAETRYQAPPVGTNYSAWHVWNMYGTTGEWGSFWDGVSMGVYPSNTPSFYTAPSIGAFNGGNFFRGYFAAVYFFSAKLSDADRAIMNAYISEKFYL